MIKRVNIREATQGWGLPLEAEKRVLLGIARIDAGLRHLIHWRLLQVGCTCADN